MDSTRDSQLQTNAPRPPAGQDVNQPRWKAKTAAFLAGQTVSLFGSSLVQYAIIWYVTLKTQSGAMIAISSICSFAPQIVISLFAGVWADRYDRKKIIILADTMIAAATLVLAIFFFLGYGQLWMIFIVAGIRSLGSGLQSPAIGALLPQFVPTDKLMRVNGINSTVQSLILLVSPAVSGALYALSRMEYIFFIDVATAAVAVTIMLLLRIPPHKKATEAQTTGYFDDLKAGFAYVRGHALVKSLLGFFALFMFLVVPAAFLTPLMVTRSFGPEVWRLTAIEMLFSGGSLLGGLVVAVWGGFKKRSVTLAVTCGLFGVLNIALGMLPWFWSFLALMFVIGTLIPFFNSASMVMIQQQVEQEYQGRVFSFLNIVMVAAMPVGTFLFGPVADVTKIEYLLIGTGVAMMVLSLWAWLDRSLKTADAAKTPEPQEQE